MIVVWNNVNQTFCGTRHEPVSAFEVVCVSYICVHLYVKAGSRFDFPAGLIIAIM